MPIGTSKSRQNLSDEDKGTVIGECYDEDVEIGVLLAISTTSVAVAAAYLTGALSSCMASAR